jgi:hypothetical protein
LQAGYYVRHRYAEKEIPAFMNHLLVGFGGKFGIKAKVFTCASLTLVCGKISAALATFCLVFSAFYFFALAFPTVRDISAPNAVVF